MCNLCSCDERGVKYMIFRNLLKILSDGRYLVLDCRGVLIGFFLTDYDSVYLSLDKQVDIDEVLDITVISVNFADKQVSIDYCVD